MAGNYPDPPGPRLAYDRDGTQVYARWGNLAFDVPGALVGQAALNALNDESTATAMEAGYGANDAAILVLFPALRDIGHIHLSCQASQGLTFAWSPDTTNGTDGTWNTVTVANQANTRTAMRTAIAATPTILGAKALRYTQDNGGSTDPRTWSLHLYGKPSATSDRLEFWHPTLDQPLSDFPAYLDWGNRPQGTSQMRQVRVKNLSGSLTANSVTVGMQALTDATPTLVSQHQFSVSGSAYAATVSLGNMSPGQVSDVINIEQTLLSNAVLGLWDQRVYADAGSWS